MSETLSESATTLAKQFAANAEFYADYAKHFTVGSLGWNGNMAESEKYAGMSARMGVLSRMTEKGR